MGSFFSRSPHLAAVATRSVDRLALPFLDRCFSLALDSGGELEWDFSRSKSASYNPLPARIALILLNDGKIRSASVIAAAMLASVGITSDECASVLPDEEAHPIVRMLQQTENFPGVMPQDLSELRAVASIVCALWLDRARHIHLVNCSNKVVFWRTFLNDLSPIITATASAQGTLHLLLSTWTSRFSERLQMSMSHPSRSL